MKKFISILLPLYLFSMPQEISEYSSKIISSSSGSLLKNSIINAKNVLEDGRKIYEEEIDDVNANIQIEGHRVLKSRNINFLFNKHIKTLDLLFDLDHIDDIANNKFDDLNNNLDIK